MPEYMYAGTYAPSGVHVLARDPFSGQLRPVGSTPAPQASWVTPHPNGRYVYVTNEVHEFEGRPGGGVSAFAIDQATGLLSPLNTQPTRGALPCHAVVDATGRYLLVATYQGATVEMFPIQADGRLGPVCDLHKHGGSSRWPGRREEPPHAHSVTLDPANRFALVADLGTDTVVLYELDLDRGELIPHPDRDAHVAPGSGPRHLAFHPQAGFAYLINELSATITAFAYQAATGQLSEIATVSTLPDGFTGVRGAAEIAVHPSGRFLYATNRSDGSGEPPERGEDTIAWFAIDGPTGRLRERGRAATGGEAPRSFVIGPGGTRLYVANQRGNSITGFLIDVQTGDLTPDGDPTAVSAPVCLQLAVAPLRSASPRLLSFARPGAMPHRVGEGRHGGRRRTRPYRVHHFSATVTDVEASVAWYQRLFGMDRVPVTFPHYACEETGYAVLLVDSRSGVAIGLHTNRDNAGETFDECRTGLDHVSFGVASHADLAAWVARLDELGIEHTGIRDEQAPFAYSTVVFRDPDNIQLELFWASA